LLVLFHLCEHNFQCFSSPSAKSSALYRIFNAIPSSPFSAATELRLLTPSSELYPLLIQISNPLVYSCSIHPCRPTSSGSLEKQIGKARSSMPLRTCLMDFSITVYAYKMEENHFIQSCRMIHKSGNFELIYRERSCEIRDDIVFLLITL
jgi:hypothetical protein